MNEKIFVLNKLGYHIVEIINPLNSSSNFYLYDMFEPVTTIGTVQTTKHRVKGRNITQFLSDRSTMLHLNTSQIEEGTIRSNVIALPIVMHEYSSHFLWINYVAVL